MGTEEGLARRRGDWGLYYPADLDGLLYGIRIPTRLHRERYLLKLTGNDWGVAEILDFTVSAITRC